MSSGRYYRPPNGLQVAVPGKLSYWMFAELCLKLCQYVALSYLSTTVVLTCCYTPTEKLQRPSLTTGHRRVKRMLVLGKKIKCLFKQNSQMSKAALKCQPRNLETTSHQLSITNYMLQIYYRVDKVDQIYYERAETVYKGKGSY